MLKLLKKAGIVAALFSLGVGMFYYERNFVPEERWAFKLEDGFPPGTNLEIYSTNKRELVMPLRYRSGASAVYVGDVRDKKVERVYQRDNFQRSPLDLFYSVSCRSMKNADMEGFKRMDEKFSRAIEIYNERKRKK